MTQRIKGFTEEISLTPLIGDNELWRVNNTFAWQVGSVGSRLHVVVPEGFIYDLASVPKLARLVVPHTTAPQSSALHDFMYRYNQVLVVEYWEDDGTPVYRNDPVPAGKYISDREYLKAMLALRVRTYRAKSAYYGVRLGGGSSWKGLRENNLVYDYGDKVKRVKPPRYFRHGR